METAAAFHPFKIEMAALPGLSMWQNEVAFAYYPRNENPIFLLIILATNLWQVTMNVLIQAAL